MVEIRSEARSDTNQQRLSEDERGASGGLVMAEANARNEAMIDMDSSTMALVRSDEAARDGDHSHQEWGEERHQSTTALVRDD